MGDLIPSFHRVLKEWLTVAASSLGYSTPLTHILSRKSTNVESSQHNLHLLLMATAL